MDDLSHVTFVLAIPYVPKCVDDLSLFFLNYFNDLLQLFYDDLSQATFVLIVR